MLHDGYGGANQPSTSRSHIQIYSARNKTGSNDAIQLEGKVSRNIIKNNSSSLTSRDAHEDETIVVGGGIASGNSSKNHL